MKTVNVAITLAAIAASFCVCANAQDVSGAPLAIAPPAQTVASNTIPAAAAPLIPAAVAPAAAPATLTPVSVTSDKSAPEKAAPAVSSRIANMYKLGPGDEIRVSVFNEPDMKVEQKIDAEGGITLPLVGDVSANGLTTAELASVVETKLKPNFMRDPHVSVTVLTYRPFYVTGEVAKPGAYPYTADLTVASAIATAGGYARGASRSSTYVRRMGQPTEQRLNDEGVVEPGDTVRVGRSALSSFGDLPLGLLRFIP